MDKPFKMKIVWEEDSDWGSDYPRAEKLVDSEDNLVQKFKLGKYRSMTVYLRYIVVAKLKDILCCGI